MNNACSDGKSVARQGYEIGIERTIERSIELIRPVMPMATLANKRGVGWLAMVVWAAIIEPMDRAAPWVYPMTAVVPPASLLVVGAALTWTARALLRCLSPYFLRLASTRT